MTSRGWPGARLALLMVAGLTAGAVAVDPALADDRLLELLDTRLELMDEVAAHKWRQDLAIEDPQREAAVLEQAVADALRHGLTPASSRAFFVAQIEAAKSIQRHWFRVWEADGEPGPAPDLETVVRPALSRLGDDILAAASRSRPISRRAFDAAVAVAGLDDAARGAVFQALVELEHFADRLEQILATGVLRIGTTGDYAPFSYRDGSAEAPRGIDIDLARNLAAALGVEAVFVATSWPDLMEDLAEGRYDVAMSGVSRTLERQKLGYQSAAYYVGGKTTIARCAEADRYGSLAAIDRAGVRVIVNPGGTNEQFVDGHIRQAAKVLHDDNRTIFAALVAGRADVMITDRIEVELQTARHPELCPTMPGTLSYQQKAYLMPRDEAWKAFVDTWLALALADGTVAAIFRDHGVEPR